MRIALDAMGGDYAPRHTIEGAVLALREYPFVEKLFLVGDTVAIENELKRLDCKDSRIEIFHASEVVSMKESAAKAVRNKKDASICRAVDLVKNGSAHAVVSAGHTGAAVAAAVLKLRTLKGIGRPAIVCLLPTESKVFVLIDGGAADHCHDAVMIAHGVAESFQDDNPAAFPPAVPVRGRVPTQEACEVLPGPAGLASPDMPRQASSWHRPSSRVC